MANFDTLKDRKKILDEMAEGEEYKEEKPKKKKKKRKNGWIKSALAGAAVGATKNW